MGIRIRSLTVKERREVDYKEGMTVAQVLQEGKVPVPHGGIVTVYHIENGKVTEERRVPENELPTSVVADNETVVVTPPVSNG